MLLCPKCGTYCASNKLNINRKLFWLVMHNQPREESVCPESTFPNNTRHGWLFSKNVTNQTNPDRCHLRSKQIICCR